MNTRIVLLVPVMSLLVHGCGSQPLPRMGRTSQAGMDVGENGEKARASSPAVSASSAPSKASPSFTTADDHDVIEHPVGELPPHNLRNCVPNAGGADRKTSGFTPAPSGSNPTPSQVIRTVHHSCWFSSECSARRGQAPEPTDGIVSISCKEAKCTCTVTTHVTAEVHRYTFFETDPCRDIKNLLRQRCGG